MTTRKEIGNFITSKRMQLALTQEQFAQATKLPIAKIIMWEKGKSLISKHEYEALCVRWPIFKSGLVESEHARLAQCIKKVRTNMDAKKKAVVSTVAPKPVKSAQAPTSTEPRTISVEYTLVYKFIEELAEKSPETIRDSVMCKMFGTDTVLSILCDVLSKKK